MSKQKKSRQQISLEERKARKRGIKQKSVNKPFWKKPIFIGSVILLLVAGLLYANQSKKDSESLSTNDSSTTPLISPSISANSALPEGAKVKRRGRWVMAKDLQPGDSIWYNGKWQVLTSVNTIDTLLPEDPKLPIMDYFVEPNHLQQVFAFRPIPLAKYTAKELEIQRSFNKDNLLLSYATIPDSVYAQYDNLKLPPNQRNIDFDEITPWTWKTFNLEIVNPDSSKVKIQLRRPHWWMSQHKIKGVGSKVRLSLPDQGIGGIATVTFIRPCQIDTRLLKDRNKLGKVFRPFTGWFERTSGNVWDYAFSSGEKMGATPEHPYFSEDRQLYIPIGEVRIGERLKTHNGQIVTLVAKKKRSKGVEKVYNLEIYRTHTFYAGKDGFLVHNSYISNVPLNKHQNFLKHKGKFEAQGDNIVIKDQALLKEVESLGNKQDDFFKDLIDNGNLVDAVVGNPKLVEGWQILSKNPVVRKNQAVLQKIYELLNNSYLSSNGLSKAKLAIMIEKLNANGASFNILKVGRQNNGLKKYIDYLEEVNKIAPRNIKKVLDGLVSDPPGLFGELFRLRACQELGWNNIRNLEWYTRGRQGRYIDIVTKDNLHIETKYYATLENKSVGDINTYLRQIEKDLEASSQGQSFEHWLGRTRTITNEAQLHREIKDILMNNTKNYVNNWFKIKYVDTGLIQDIDSFISARFKFKDFN